MSMDRMLRGFLLLLLLAPMGMQGQSVRKISGITRDDSSEVAIPFANVYNKSLGKGTISNDEGYFELPYRGPGDSIVVSHLGYRPLRTVVPPNADRLELRLVESPYLIEDVVITAVDDPYLYELLAECRDEAVPDAREGKAYYELTTFKEREQVELVEGYYNIETQGYDIADLDIKTGRLAIKPLDNTLFVSLESSNAVLKQKLLQKVPYYPISPLQLSKRRMRKRFYLALDRKYLSPESDSIYILECAPKQNLGQDYAGLIWVNKTQKRISRLELECKDCKRHPFLPLFPSDSIEQVNIQFQKTYQQTEGNANFNYVNLDYDIRYRSRRNELREDTFTVHTHALLYAYDYQQRFFIPEFDFGPLAYSDYRKINAIPYNYFFWNYHDEYSLNDRKGVNERFFRSRQSLTNENLFQASRELGKGMFETPYLDWSRDRVFILQSVEDTLSDPASVPFNSETYHLEFKIFLDYNAYGDSTNLVSRTLFAPHESYFYQEIDMLTHCFVNILFDLCEIERQRLEEEVKALLDTPEQIPAHVKQFQIQFQNKKRHWLKEMDIGNNKTAVLRYNKQVRKALKIDNVDMYKPYEEE